LGAPLAWSFFPVARSAQRTGLVPLVVVESGGKKLEPDVGWWRPPGLITAHLLPFSLFTRTSAGGRPIQFL